MASSGNTDKWYFTKEQLESTPSRKCGYDHIKELSYRQQAANFIQDMGQRLKVSQLCINTAIVYMHRFYVFHSFTHFPWTQMAAAALFLAAKVEEQPRKLEYVIRVANLCKNSRDTQFDVTSERYLAQSQDLVFNENVLLQTLGFDVAIDHPHTHVVRCCHLVRASKDLAQTSYFMASNSLHLTTMCIQYKPTVVACFCIMVACKWSNWEIPLSNERKEWYSYVDSTVTAELLQQLTEEFLVIFETCPSRLKEKIMAISENIHISPGTGSSLFDQDPKKIPSADGKDHNPLHSINRHKAEHPDKHRSSRPPSEAGSSSQQQREREYRERKERERLAAQQHGAKVPSNPASKPPPHGYHKPPVDPKIKPHTSRPPSASGYAPSGRQEPRDILREATREPPSTFGLSNKDYRSDHSKDARDHARSEKDKRDYLFKQNPAETNATHPDSRYSVDKRVDPNKPRVDPNKHPSARRHEPKQHEPAAANKHEPTAKQYPENSVKTSSGDHSSSFMKPTSQKTKSPFNYDSSKSVPNKMAAGHSNSKPMHHNGSSNGGNYNLPLLNNEPQTPEMSNAQPVLPVKKPSLFSPEKSPPSVKKTVMKNSPSTIRKIMEPSPSSFCGLPSLSPISSPKGRSRNYSTSSEPELRPVMKKIDEVEGFENLMRDATIGSYKLQNKVPDSIDKNIKLENIKREIDDDFVRKEVKIEDNKNVVKREKTEENNHEKRNIKTEDSYVKREIKLEPILDTSTHPIIGNGIETNPTLISNLLKEPPPIASHLNTIVPPSVDNSASSISEASSQQPEEKKEHHHKSKKKNKEKHKHKDKDRSKEDKEKKKKHKDKDREKHKKDKHSEETASSSLPAEPIKIKIQKDKIHTITESPSGGLKIKIPKDKIKTENIGEPSKPVQLTGGLKIKIPKEVINNCIETNRKRERDKTSYSEGPPTKIHKSSYKEKQNGRHSYNKVTHGDGDAKHSNKGSTS